MPEVFPHITVDSCFIDMIVAMNSEFDGSHYRQYLAGSVEM
jgi:hypothetical protein